MRIWTQNMNISRLEQQRRIEDSKLLRFIKERGEKNKQIREQRKIIKNINLDIEFEKEQ